MSYLNDQNHYLTGTYLGEDAPQEVAMPDQAEQPAPPAQIPFLQRTITIPGLGAITYQTILVIALALLLLYYLRRRI